MGESHVVAFTLYDPLGNDVTDAYALEIRTGRLWVTGEAVEVFLYPLETVCGDAPAVWQEGDYEILLAPEGVTLELEIRLERTEPGFITLADLQDRPGGGRVLPRMGGRRGRDGCLCVGILRARGDGGIPGSDRESAAFRLMKFTKTDVGNWPKSRFSRFCGKTPKKTCKRNQTVV